MKIANSLYISEQPCETMGTTYHKRAYVPGTTAAESVVTILAIL